MVTEYNIEIVQGDTYNAPITITSNIEDVDWSTLEYWVTVKESEDNEDVDAKIGPKALVLDDDDRPHIQFTQTETNLEVKTYYYDVQANNDDYTFVRTLIRGLLIIKPQITRKSSGD